ncbi:MAG: ATP-dependent zinc metalloprotease FtsH [Chloroflexi bacterium]|nr:ATP-dependent zinc metalloprotease FtsH [Chloroflexota bacterium]
MRAGGWLRRGAAPGQERSVRFSTRSLPRDALRPRPPGPEEPRGSGERQRGRPVLHSRWSLVILIMLISINWIMRPILWPDQKPRVVVPYTVFREQVDVGNVVEITTRGDSIQGTLKRALTYAPAGERPLTSNEFETRVPSFADSGLESQLRARQVVINARSLDEGRSWWMTILLSFGPALLFFGMIVWMMGKAGRGAGGLFSLGRSRARRYNAGQHPRITFQDVAGIEEAEAELAEIVDFLRHPEKYQRLGGSIPKGVLLVGPPGTGKTLLARAVAGEAGVPFFSLSGSEFIEMVVGVGAARVRDLFAQAKREAPAIIFVDELDAIGRRRGGVATIGGHEEREQTLNQLLVEMDGFDARQAVIVLAATNRSDVLDPALLRPGRFDRRVVVQRPDRAGREAILNVHTRGVPLASDVRLVDVAASTPGLVGADLRNLVNEAALLAARREQNVVRARDFSDALDRIVLGAARPLVMREEDRCRTAYHEAGHALVGLLCPEADPVRKITIVPRGQALGATFQQAEDDRYSYSEPYLRARIAGAMGGRAAEHIVFDVVTTGCENDLLQATQLARRMVTRWGMSREVGPVALVQEDAGDFLGSGETSRPRELSETLAAQVDEEVRRLLDEGYQRALELLSAERSKLESLAAALLERESLDEEDVRHVVGFPPKRGAEASEEDGLSELAPSSSVEARRNGGTAIHRREMAPDGGRAPGMSPEE